jgi:hypothetical protein
MSGISHAADILAGLDTVPGICKLVNLKNFYREVKPGDHIAIPSNSKLEGPWHHAIYIGDDKLILSAQQQIRCVDMDTFALQVTFAVVIYENDSDKKRQTTIECANTLIGAKPTKSLKCEIFPVLCRTGVKRCASYSSIVCDQINVLAQEYTKPASKFEK